MKKLILLPLLIIISAVHLTTSPMDFPLKMRMALSCLPKNIPQKTSANTEEDLLSPLLRFPRDLQRLISDLVICELPLYAQLSPYRHTFEGHTSPILSIAFNKRNQLIIASCDSVRTWGLKKYNLVREYIGQGSGAFDIKLNDDGHYLLQVDAKLNKLNVCDFASVKNNKPPFVNMAKPGVTCTNLSGKYLLIGMAPNKKVYIKDLTRKDGNWNPVEETEPFNVDISPDGTYLVTLGYTAKVREVKNPQNVRHFDGGDFRRKITASAFSRNSNLLATGSEDGTAKLWNLQTGKFLQEFVGHQDSILTIAMYDNYLVTGSSDHTAKLWNIETGTCIYTFKGHSGAVCSMAFSQDGTMFATGSEDGTAKLWDLTHIETFAQKILPKQITIEELCFLLVANNAFRKKCTNQLSPEMEKAFSKLDPLIQKTVKKWVIAPQANKTLTLGKSLQQCLPWYSDKAEKEKLMIL